MTDQLPNIDEGYFTSNDDVTTTNEVFGTSADEASFFDIESAHLWDNTAQAVMPRDLAIPLSRYIQPILEYPSDRMVFRTVTLNNNDAVNGPVMLVNRQNDGMGCRVRVRNVGTTNISLLINPESATASATVTQVYSDGFYLPANAEVVFSTRSAIWAISPGAPGTGLLAVAIETYVIDQPSNNG